MTSLRRAILIWMTGLIALIGVLGAATAYGFALWQAGSFMDNQLRQIALNAGPGLPEEDVPALAHDTEDDFVVQIWNADEQVVHASPSQASIPRQPRSGFADIRLGGVPWRTFTSSSPTQTVQVAQRYQVRREVAQQAAWQTALPILAIIPLGWLVLNAVMSKVLGGLRQVAAKVGTLTADSRQPIDLAHVPLEVAPLVTAMNALIERLRRTLAQQQKFLSDAAHELRTPITAIRLQIGNLAADTLSDGAGQNIDDLRRGAERASTLVNQLLRTARYEAKTDVVDHKRLDVAEVILMAVADHIPIAESRDIDLGVLSYRHVTVEGEADDLRVLFGNLIDNAIRYTPSGGTVDVEVTATDDGCLLTVQDTGPGIEPALLPRIFDRFFRAAPIGIEGSGLGLAICKAIADRHDLLLSVANRQDRSGLRVSVQWRALAAWPHAPEPHG